MRGILYISTHTKKVLESIFKAVTAKKGPSCLEGVHPSTGLGGPTLAPLHVFWPEQAGLSSKMSAHRSPQEAPPVLSCPLHRTGRLFVEMPFETPGDDMSQDVSYSRDHRSRTSLFRKPQEITPLDICSTVATLCESKSVVSTTVSSARKVVCNPYFPRALSTIDHSGTLGGSLRVF